MQTLERRPEIDDSVRGEASSDRPDDHLRAGLDFVGVLSRARGGRPTWVARLKWGNLSLLPLLAMRARRRREEALDDAQRAASVRRAAVRRQEVRLAEYLLALLALLLILGGGAYEARIGGRPEAVISGPLTAGQPDAGAAADPSQGGGDDNGGGGGPTTTLGTVVTTPTTVRPPVPTTTVRPPVPPTVPPTTVPPPDLPPRQADGGPLLQVAALAQAGLDGGLAIGLGEGACVGLRIQALTIGCDPGGRGPLGVTADVSGSLLPPIHLSIP